MVVAGLVDESAVAEEEAPEAAAVEDESVVVEEEAPAPEAADVEDEVAVLLCLCQPMPGPQTAVGLVEVHHWNFFVEVGYFGSCLCKRRDKLIKTRRKCN